MKKVLRKTVAFAVVAAMFLTGSSVFAGEQLTGVDKNASGPATVDRVQAEATDVLKGEAREAEPVGVKSLKGAADFTAKTLTYKGTPKPAYQRDYYVPGDDTYYYASVDVKTKGVLCVDAIASSANSYGLTVYVGGDHGLTQYISPGQTATGIGAVAVSSGTYYIGFKSTGNVSANFDFRAYVYSSKSPSVLLKAGKIMLTPGNRYVYSSDDDMFHPTATTRLFKIKPAKSGYIKVTLKERGYSSSSGYVTLLNKNKKAVSKKLSFISGSSTSKAVFGVKKGVTYYIKVANCSGSSSKAFVYETKFSNVKATVRSNTKKSKAKKLTRKASYISTVMPANNKSGNQWYKFKVTKKRKTVIKVDAKNLVSGTTKISVYAGSKFIGSSTISNGRGGDVNAFTVTNSTTYGKANSGTYYVKIHKSQKANGVYKIKYAQ